MAQHTIQDLRPASTGWDLLVKVLQHKVVVDGGGGGGGGGNRGGGGGGGHGGGGHHHHQRIAECLVGDATGTAVLSARGSEQVQACSKPGTFLRLRNARVDMYRGSMRLCVAAADGGALEALLGEEEAEAAASVGKVDESNNMSLLEFELVQVEGVPMRTVETVRAQAAKGEAAAAAAAAAKRGGKRAEAEEEQEEPAAGAVDEE